MISEKTGMERGLYYWNHRKMADSGVLLSCGTDLTLLIDNIPEGGEPFNKQNMLTVKGRQTKSSSKQEENLLFGTAFSLFSSYRNSKK